MAEAFDTLGMLYQNLQDAGCDAQTVQACMAPGRSGKRERNAGPPPETPRNPLPNGARGAKRKWIAWIT